MTPGALRAFAFEAATNREWVKAADLHSQAVDLENARRYNPYNSGPPIARPVDPVSPNTTPEQRAEAERMLAGREPLTLET